MMRLSKPLLSVMIASLASLCGNTALADDTEIFELAPTSAAAARPNILLIIDTSGSMVSNSVKQPAEYDPLLSYSGSCSANLIYWRQGSGAATCTGAGKDRHITSAQLVCKTAKDRVEGTGTTGTALGTFVSAGTVQWKASTTKQWVALDTSLSDPAKNVVECTADAAIGHGLADSDGKLPKNGSSGPWTTDPTQASNVSASAATYTFAKGNYLNYLEEGGASGTVTLTRLEIVQSTARRFLDSLSNVNVGLMRFERTRYQDGVGQGGYVIHEFAPIETARQDLKDAVTALTGISLTPLSETMYEAFLYWKGGQPRYGNDSNSQSVPGSLIGGSYKSPLGASCASNFNVLLTDGDPTSDRDADDEIARLTGMTSAAEPAVPNSCSEDGGDGKADLQDPGDGRCLNDIVKYMHDQDLFDDPAVNQNADPPEFEAKNNVRTYTIGFGDGMSALGEQLLRSTAAAGEGKYYSASDGIALDAAFQDITREVVDANVSFSAPTVAVNAFNRTQNLNDLFMTVFAPSDQFHWAGNLKKYRLRADGTIMDDTRDPGPQPAVNPTSGFFAEDSRSFWSDVEDGPKVTLGGAAHELPTPATRRVFTDVKPGSALTSDDNKVGLVNGVTNPNITAVLTGLGTATAAELEAHVNWIRGADVDNEDVNLRSAARFEMGDPLHSRPVSVIYRGTASAPVGVIYAATNDGYLHAIDPSDGHELWSYIPSELLPRMAELRENDITAAKTYGLDGNLRAFKLDRDGDGVIEPATTNGDRVLLFFGMGRGGDTYYALDVTDETTPKLLWKHSGSTGDNQLVGLGESWSTPVVTRVNINGASQNPDKLVVIFGGGYDNSQDNVGYHTDAIGNRLFMVDAINGNVLWHAGPTSGLPGFDSSANFKDAKLINSIPADIRVIDITSDGLADRMYASDTGGRVWRFDIINGNSANTLVRGGVLASLGMDVTSGVSSPADARKFYVAPDASLVTTGSGVTFVNLAIGSGMRGSPKNTQVADRLYSLRDYNPFTQLTATQYTDMTAAPITDASLVDVTTNVTPTIGAAATGWKIRLTASGEKALAEARTFQGAVLFTTYDPDADRTVGASGCTSTAGRNSVWVMKVLDAAPYIDRDGDATIEAEDRRADLAQQGLAPEAVIIFPSPDDPANCQGAQCSPPPVCLVGLENCGVSFTDAPIKTFWSQRDVD